MHFSKRNVEQLLQKQWTVAFNQTGQCPALNTTHSTQTQTKTQSLVIETVRLSTALSTLSSEDTKQHTKKSDCTIISEVKTGIKQAKKKNEYR